MPTIATEGIYKLTIYANDHPPPHTQVRWRGDALRIDLRTLEPMERARGNTDVKAIQAAVRKHRKKLMKAWDKYHP